MTRLPSQGTGFPFWGKALVVLVAAGLGGLWYMNIEVAETEPPINVACTEKASEMEEAAATFLRSNLVHKFDGTLWVNRAAWQKADPDTRTSVALIFYCRNNMNTTLVKARDTEEVLASVTDGNYATQ